MRSAKLSYVITACFFIVLVGGGGAIDTIQLIRNAGPFPRERVSWQGLWSGDDARVLEEYVREESALINRIRPAYNELLFRFAGTANPGIVVGTDALFDSSHVRPQSEAYWRSRREDVVGFAREFQAALDVVDARLIVVMVPDRIRVHPEKLPEIDLANSPKGPYYGDVVRDLRALGIETIDLESDLRAFREKIGWHRRLIRRDDHHWNDVAAREAARLIEERLLAMGVRPGAATDLVLRGEEETGVHGSLLERAGWPKDSAIFKQFRETPIKYSLYQPDGQVARETWDADVAVVADSFGSVGVAPMISASMRIPVADLTKAGKSHIYSVYRLFDLIAAGWRPREVVWLFEEGATYSGAVRSSGFLLRPLVSSLAKGFRERALPMSAIVPGEGAEGRLEAGSLVVRNRRKYFVLTIDRAAVPADELVVYLAPTFRLHRWAFVGLYDAATPADETVTEQRLFVADGEPDCSQRLVLPVPEGSGALELRFEASHLGGVFRCDGLTVMASLDGTTAGARAEPVPTGFVPFRFKLRNTSGRNGPRLAAEEAEAGGRHFLGTTVDRTLRLVGEPPLERPGRVELGIRNRAPRSDLEPALVSLLLVAEGKVDRILAQCPVAAGEAATLDAEITEIPEGGRLAIDVWIPRRSWGAYPVELGFARD